jgi:hypothetical protein
MVMVGWIRMIVRTHDDREQSNSSLGEDKWSEEAFRPYDDLWEQNNPPNDAASPFPDDDAVVANPYIDREQLEDMDDWVKQKLEESQ